jgi:serine phosphatase RsbU (regulator of sigma subunit)
MKKIIIFIIFLLPLYALAQDRKTDNYSFNIDSFTIPDVYYPLYDNWRFSQGDDPAMAAPDYDDSKWDTVNSILRIGQHSRNKYDNFGMGWFRVHIATDSTVNGFPLALKVSHYGASEIYFDGKKIATYGMIDGKKKSIYYDPQYLPIFITVQNAGPHVIAVRYAYFDAKKNYKRYKSTFRGFELSIGSAKNLIRSSHLQTLLTSVIYLLVFGIFISLAMSNLFLYLYNKSLKPNLFFSLFCASIAIGSLSVFLSRTSTEPIVQLSSNYIAAITVSAGCYALAGFTGELFTNKKLQFRIITVFCILCPILWLIHTGLGIISYLFLVGTVTGRSIVVTSLAIYRKKKGARTVGVGILFFTLFVFTTLMVSIKGLTINENTPAGIAILSLTVLAVLSIPISISLYLAWDFAGINKNLKNQLDQVQLLSERSLEQEKEKKELLERQKDDLEREVALRTSEVVAQKQVIELKNKAITDNINYAQRIQSAILPDTKLIFKHLGQSFILFLPKDIVSGDFYTFSERNNRVLISAGDCTGHGVSGALMSMTGSSLLNQIINEKGIAQPSLILDQLNVSLIGTFRQGENESNDGMDIAICSLDLTTYELQYAGANRPLWLIRNGEVEVIRPDKFPIGGLQVEKGRVYTNNAIQLQKNDTIYIFTDGYADQFGGEKGKKLMTARFKELLQSIQQMNMTEQEQFLGAYFEQWKGSNEQVDDVLVIGVRL